MPGFGVGESCGHAMTGRFWLTADEIDQLERAVAGVQMGSGWNWSGIFCARYFSERLKSAQCQLENGAGFVYVRGLPVDRFDEGQLRRLFWGIAIHLGTPVSQSAAGERLFSVADAGYAREDARSRGPNTSRKLSFHTDRCDVIGFCCHRQAKQGGENYIVSSMALYNAILEQRLDLLAVLCEPFYYLRHTVDGGNDRPWCRQPVFSFCEGQFAANLLRVLIDRAHAHPDLPDLTPEQTEALDLVEALSVIPRCTPRSGRNPAIWCS